MGKEQIRVSIMVLDRTIMVGEMQFLGGITVPRRTIGQLKDLSISALDATEVDGLTDLNWVTAAGLVRGNTGRANRAFQAADWGTIDTIVAEMFGVKGSGLVPVGSAPMSKININRDFVDGDPRSRINMRSGPNTNFENGFQFYLAGLGEDATKAFLLGTMTVELDWPKSKSMPWKSEHIANEENQ